MKTGMQPAMMVSLSLRVLAESPGIERQKVALRMRSMMLLQAACSTLCVPCEISGSLSVGQLLP